MTEIRHDDNDSNPSAHVTGKGKRSERPHTPSLLTLTMACTSTSLSNPIGGEADGTTHRDQLTTKGSPSSSENMELEEDLANCLILLAQGSHDTKGGAATIMNTNLGSNSFECKTCSRCFSSFQALGGHRTSHKKPKTTVTEDAPGRNSDASFSSASTELSLRITTPVRVFGDTNTTTTTTTSSLSKPRAHECSICGSEFSTGQALGGHMRRHRRLTKANTGSTSRSSPVMKGKNALALELDLNLPAPEDRESTTYCFQAKGSLPLGVDCHI